MHRLEREAAEARALYDSYRKRFPQITNAARSLQVLQAPERIRVIDAARDPQFPASSRLKFVIVGLLASILLAAGLVGCAELLDQRLHHAPDFEAAAGVPVIGRLPAARAEPVIEDQTAAPVPDNVTPISKGRQSAA